MGLVRILTLSAIGVGVVATLAKIDAQLPEWAAPALLHPSRTHIHGGSAGRRHEEVTFTGEGVTLAGWRFATPRPRRGTVIYLHGIADNRGSSAPVAERLTANGFDVIAYDSRAHGDSTGDVCTYGYYEKQDLDRVIDTIPPGPVVLIGASLGAAVALQTAASHPRVNVVVAAETFSDLRTVATERAPFFLTAQTIRRAFAVAERDGHFKVDDVSPVRAAWRITVPVLVIHGEVDRDTPPGHSRRVYEALAGPKQLLIVEGAGHNESFWRAWTEIEQWLDKWVPMSGT
jgi:uncharacterized protein